MKISAVQIQFFTGNIPSGLNKYLKFIDVSVTQGADFIFFVRVHVLDTVLETVDMSLNSISAYEKHAQKFLQRRDKSTVGVQVTKQWARSLKPNAEVIEIACGGGIPVTQTLVNAKLKLWAIDSSRTLISIFQERFPEVPAQCATVLKSDFFLKKFDAAISIGLIFLLSEADQIKMIKRVSAILRPGASFLFTAPIEKGAWVDVNTGHSCISLGQDAYENALTKSGFQVMKRYEDNGKNNYYESERRGRC